MMSFTRHWEEKAKELNREQVHIKLVKRYLPETEKSPLFCPTVQTQGAFLNVINVSLSKGGLLQSFKSIKNQSMQKQRMKYGMHFKLGLGNPLTPRHVGSVLFRATVDIL